MRILFLIQFFTIFVIHAEAQKTDSIPAKDSLIPKHIFRKGSFYVDNNYSALSTRFGGVNMEKDVFSFSVAYGYYGMTSKRMAIDLNIEISYKHFLTDTMYFDYVWYWKGPQLRSGIYECKRFFISLPIGFNYQWGKKIRFGFSGFLAPKINVWGKVSGTEHLWDGTTQNTTENYSRLVNKNLEARVGLIFEFPLGEYKLRLLPIYRINMFREYEHTNYPKSFSYGLGMEFMF